MARKPTGKPNGRPPIELDWKEFETLCAVQCTIEEIADHFDCDEKTIQAACERKYGETFSSLYKKKQGGGKRSLRRLMWQQARQGNTTMLIWLSKQVLGYTDKVDQHNKHSGGIEVNSRSSAIEEIFQDERSIELARELAERMSGPQGGPTQ